MCGIAGVVLPRGPIGPELARSFLERLAHRGPDDQGTLAIGDTGVLVHRRLSIIDLSEAGRQPLANERATSFIAFNGEIYDYLELRAELENLGARFRTRTDTEVLLAAWERWGPASLARLTGMFAFAIVDLEKRKLVLARDPFGIKPLYWTRWRGGIAFASEIPPLLELEGVSRAASPARVFDYLAEGITDHEGETLFKDIAALPPGSWAEASLDDPSSLVVRRWFELDLGARSELSFEAAAEKLRELFLESVRLHLRSDVPVGAALSGGIDSSSIVCAARRLSGDAELHAFGFIADDPALSEERWIDLAGEAARARVHKVTAHPEDLPRDLDRLIRIQGEPFVSTSIWAQHRVFALARERGIKVMLDGQGADELLGGYHVYAGSRLASLLRQGKLVEAVKFLGRASRQPGRQGLWLHAGTALPGALQAPLRRLIGRGHVPAWLREPWFRERGAIGAPVRDARGTEVLREKLLETLTRTSLPMLLRYEDRSSMAESLESRVPFLTPKIASFVLSLPEEFIISPDGTSKAVFRRAMRGIVPDEILDRRDKKGFATPEERWLGELRPWVDAVLGSETARALPVLDGDAVRDHWRRVSECRSRFDGRVWRWINLVRWAEAFGVQFQ